MKLSEKLAALEAQERAEKGSEKSDNGAARRGARTERRPGADRRSTSTWTDAKRKVRDLVLTELAPKLAGPKALSGPALAKEVKSTVDRVLRREDMKISPIERQK